MAVRVVLYDVVARRAHIRNDTLVVGKVGSFCRSIMRPVVVQDEMGTGNSQDAEKKFSVLKRL